MAYSTSAPPSLTTEAPLGAAGQVWAHSSVDAAAVVDTSGFITNGGDLGMKAGDLLRHTDTTNNIVTLHRVVTVSTTAPGAVDLADGTTIAGATNTD